MTELLYLSLMLSGFTPSDKIVFNVYCWHDNIQDYILEKVVEDFDKASSYVGKKDCKIEWIN